MYVDEKRERNLEMWVVNVRQQINMIKEFNLSPPHIFLLASK